MAIRLPGIMYVKHKDGYKKKKKRCPIKKKILNKNMNE